MTSTSTTLHAFERAGLGKAPFRYVGSERRVGPVIIENADGTTTEIGAPGQPMGSCDYCGQGIAECCIIQDAEGKRFVVGSSCVAKTGDAGLTKVVMREAGKRQREAQKARERTRIDAARTAWETDPRLRADYRGRPHPRIASRSLADYVDWMFKNSGHSGQLKTARRIEKAQKRLS